MLPWWGCFAQPDQPPLLTKNLLVCMKDLPRTSAEEAAFLGRTQLVDLLLSRFSTQQFLGDCYTLCEPVAWGFHLGQTTWPAKEKYPVHMHLCGPVQ